MSLSYRSNRQAAAHLLHLGLIGCAMRFLSAKWRAFGTWRAKRATIVALGELDDRGLKDIGLTRSEIGSIAYGAPEERQRSFAAIVSTAGSAPQSTGVDHQRPHAGNVASPARFASSKGIEVES